MSFSLALDVQIPAQSHHHLGLFRGTWHSNTTDPSAYKGPPKNRFGPPKNDTSDQFVSVLWIWTWARGQHKTMMMSCWQITTCPTGCRYDIYGINRRLHMRACVHSWHGKEGVWMDILWLLLPTHKLMTIETWHTFTMDKLAGWSG